ncbi:unnamed protein product [Cylicostephanus goldi]|uniref:Uncharacterized protein n=1 Tax=Cylicostephanus goldi TaxID=71465 RepID=A0A3P6R9R0_CYLGO|nr:unnamed protein product [Cylicostephanus goldi]
MEKMLSDTFERVFNEIKDIKASHNSLINRLDSLEEKILELSFERSNQQKMLYSTLVKIRSDENKLEEKSKRIALIGIDEQGDENLTRRFDREIIKEFVYTSGEQQLVEEFEKGNVTVQRYPPGQPKSPRVRGRVIKVGLRSKELRDQLLQHMRAGRQSLTQKFIHSYARRDYTYEELQLDRALRKQAGDLNAREGKLMYVVRDFEIVKLKSPRELPRRSLVSSSLRSNYVNGASGNRSIVDLEEERDSPTTNLTLSPIYCAQYTPKTSNTR